MLDSLYRSGVHKGSARHAIRRPLRPQVDPLEGRQLLTLLGQQLFPTDNPWNQNISSAPVAPNSAAIMGNIISLYGNGHFHPDFGQDTQSNNPLYGIPFNVVHGNSVAKVNVVIGAYPSESDIEPAPIPANAVIEGDNQNGPLAGLGNRRRLPPDRLGRGQQYRVRVLSGVAAERKLRRTVACRTGDRLEHEYRHVPDPGLDLGRRRRPADSPRTRPT